MSNRIRCAIYTRKSTEEGLEQDFNSLDAQREACEAYVQSQKGLGWSVIKTHYDDGGISGGTMERPALRDLLADIERNMVDLVMVYKVDRLTRSLMDFSKIIDIFDACDVSFVSVTQQFNTSSSMGRLTLNVLLSFAQFEREVTAERIRDKIAASKKKGIWMGGPVPLGYDVNDRKLIVNETEAKTLRQIFQMYVELGTVRLLKEKMDSLGIVTKYRVQKNGKETGGKPFSRGNLYQLLSNPIYMGRIPHKGETYPGEHDAIVDTDTRDAVQSLIAQNTVKRTQLTNVKGSFLLTGKVYDEHGKPLYQSQAHKRGKRYCYYISRRLMHGVNENGEGWRIPAKTLESTVTTALMDVFQNRTKLMDLLYLENPDITSLTSFNTQVDTVIRIFAKVGHEGTRSVLQGVVQRIDLARDSIALTFNPSGLAELLHVSCPQNFKPEPILIPIRLQRRGVEIKMIIGGSDAEARNVDANLCRMISQTHSWFNLLTSGQASTVREIASRENVNEHEITRVLHLAFLSPQIVEGILDGRQSEGVSVHRLRRLSSIPFDWAKQAELLQNLG